jgi:hypothetical protein
MTPAAQLKQYIAKFSPEHQRLIHAVRRKLRARFPTAHELVYDNYNFFVIGYSPTVRPSDAIVSLTAARNGIGVCFIHGASLTDPNKLLLGSGKQTRFIRVPSAATLVQPAVEALFAEAIAQSDVPLNAEGKGRLIIRSISRKQRSRR